MFRLLGCVSQQHDPHLLYLAAAVCIVASMAAIALFRQARRFQSDLRLRWLAAAAAVASSGTWATHFIAMLAYRPGVAIAFDLDLTTASYVCAIVPMLAGFILAAGAVRRAVAAVGALLVAAGVSSMHYVGIEALVLPARAHWDMAYVGASLIGAGVLALAALAAARRSGALSAVVAGATLSLAILVLHFTGMTAVQFVPDPRIVGAGVSIEPGVIAAMIATVMAAVLLIAAFGMLAARQIARREAEFNQRVRDKAYQLDLALNNMAQGLSMYDAEGRLVMCNDRYRELYELPERLVRPGTSSADILQDRIERGIVTDRAAIERFRAMFARPTERCEERLIYSDARGRQIAVLRRPLENGGWVKTHEDITEQRRAEEKITYLALHDCLTGLPNRSSLNEALAAREKDFAARGARFAIIAVDVDNFKTVNDVYGHAAGDALLSELSRRFRQAGRGAQVFRQGGDEFLLFTDTAERTELAAFAERLRRAASRDMAFDGRLLKVGLSLGVASFPEDGATIEQLLNNADAALYRAKRDGGGKVCVYAADIDRQRHEFLSLQVDLRRAIARDELELVFQPLVTIEGAAIGFEALLRWRHPVRGLVSPAVFIPVAEADGLIIEIDAWVTRRACAEAARWPAPLKVAVNISALHFQCGALPETIDRALRQSGLEPERLTVELTESALAADSRRVAATMQELKALRVELAMDDFGTGYCSLSYLHTLPFDKIKLDRSFVRDLETSEKSRSIAEAIVSLSKSLGLATLAEGVETERQAEILRRFGCDYAQGFLFGKPLPIDAYAGLTGVVGDGLLARAS